MQLFSLRLALVVALLATALAADTTAAPDKAKLKAASGGGDSWGLEVADEKADTATTTAAPKAADGAKHGAMDDGAKDGNGTKKAADTTTTTAAPKAADSAKSEEAEKQPAVAASATAKTTAKTTAAPAEEKQMASEKQTTAAPTKEQAAAAGSADKPAAAAAAKKKTTADASAQANAAAGHAEGGGGGGGVAYPSAATTKAFLEKLAADAPALGLEAPSGDYLRQLHAAPLPAALLEGLATAPAGQGATVAVGKGGAKLPHGPPIEAGDLLISVGGAFVGGAAGPEEVRALLKKAGFPVVLHLRRPAALGAFAKAPPAAVAAAVAAAAAAKAVEENDRKGGGGGGAIEALEAGFAARLALEQVRHALLVDAARAFAARALAAEASLSAAAAAAASAKKTKKEEEAGAAAADAGDSSSEAAREAIVHRLSHELEQAAYNVSRLATANALHSPKLAMARSKEAVLEKRVRHLAHQLEDPDIFDALVHKSHAAGALELEGALNKTKKHFGKGFSHVGRLVATGGSVLTAGHAKIHAHIAPYVGEHAPWIAVLFVLCVLLVPCCLLRALARSVVGGGGLGLYHAVTILNMYGLLVTLGLFVGSKLARSHDALLALRDWDEFVQLLQAAFFGVYVLAAAWYNLSYQVKRTLAEFSAVIRAIAGAHLLLAMGSGWHYYLTAIRPVLRDEKREPVSTLTYTAHIFVFASGLVLAPLYEKSKVGGLLPTTSKLH
jgi:hypothetical protein